MKISRFLDMFSVGGRVAVPPPPPKEAPARPQPRVPITDPKFQYTSSDRTDIRRTFIRVRREGLKRVP